MSQNIHMARVYLAQARAFRRHPAFHATLLEWAARRRRASRRIKQLELF